VVVEGAFAFNAKFDRAIITGADFTDGRRRDDDVQEKLCAIAQCQNPSTERTTRNSLNGF